MTKQRFLKVAGIGLLALILLVAIVTLVVGKPFTDVGNILSFLVPIVIIIGGVLYFFWWLVSMGLSKPKPGTTTEVRKPKGFVPYSERKTALNSLPNVKKLWIALIAYMILSSVYGIIRLTLEFIQNGNFSKAQEVLKGMPLTGIAIGGTLMALLFIVVQVIYIGSMYRMEKWVLTFMWIGVATILLPPFKMGNLWAFLPNVVILGAYSYILKKVYVPTK